MPNESEITNDARTERGAPVRCDDWLEVALAELLEEKRVQESKRDELEQDDNWYHYHDGVAFGIHVAIEHFRDAAKATSNDKVSDAPDSAAPNRK